MIKRLAPLLLLVLAPGLAARTLVLPLAVDTQNHASFQWLGKAVSFYLIAGLGHNRLPVCSEEELQALLGRNLVRFPHDITKATAMALAAENGAERLLWGKILYSDRKSLQLQVQLVLIDLKQMRQRYLPLVKGNYSDLFRLQEELLRNAVSGIAPGARQVILPQLNLSLPGYERLVKSLLLGDVNKKLELLRPGPAENGRSSFVHFELAKAFLDAGDAASCRLHLERVADIPYFKERKEFLLALADRMAGAEVEALGRFIRLQQQNVHPLPTHNNLGAIYLARREFSLAGKCLDYALSLGQEPAVRVNQVLLLRAMGRDAAAQGELGRALRRFPEDERLRRLFAAYLAAAGNREALARVFGDLVPLPLPEESVPEVEPQMLNPYGAAAAAVEPPSGNLPYIEARNLFLENDFEGAKQKAEEAMEINPFEPDNHHLLALLALQKRETAQADLYAQSALFLEESPGNYLLQLKVLQAGSDRERFRSVLAEARRRFPEDAELQALDDRGR